MISAYEFVGVPLFFRLMAPSLQWARSKYGAVKYSRENLRCIECPWLIQNVVGWLYSDKGGRMVNEDAALLSLVKRKWRIAVLAVADGVGGMAHGDVASHIAIEKVDTWARSLRRLPSFEDVAKLIHAVHIEIYKRLRGVGGTTLTLAAADLDTGKVVIASVGDSVAYKVSPREGAIPLAETDALGGHVISQALGVRLDRVHYSTTEIDYGDLLVLVTDGVTDVIGEEFLRAQSWRHETCGTEGIRRYVTELVRTAVDSGSKDNATAVALCQTQTM